MTGEMKMMTISNRRVENGCVTCSDGRSLPVGNCRFCLHSRYFIVDGVERRSPALSFCLSERVVEPVDYEKATVIGCAEFRGDGYTNIGNIIS